MVTKATDVYCQPLGLCVCCDRDSVKRPFRFASAAYCGVNGDLERMWKEVVMAKFHMLFHYLPGMTEKSDSNFRVSSFGNIWIGDFLNLYECHPVNLNVWYTLWNEEGLKFSKFLISSDVTSQRA